MSAEVGGRMEAVEPHRSLFGPDYARLLVLFIVAISLHGWLVVHTTVPARDSLGYARIALNLSNPPPTKEGKPRPRIEVVRTAEQPPGYPVAIWAFEKALRPFTHLDIAERSLLAAQLANAFAAVLIVVPVYLIGRILFSRNVGFAAALLFEVLPVPAHMTSDGLSEGVYLLVVATAILMGVRSARNPSVGGFLLCGLASGASYLVRPEGVGVALCVGAVIVGAGFKRLWPRDLSLGYLAAVVVGVGLVGFPYMLLIGKFTNKPTGGTIINIFDSTPARVWNLQPEARANELAHRGPELFAVWWDPIRDAGKTRELWALHAVWAELSKSLHYVIGVLAILAVLAHRRQLFSPDLGLWLILVLLAFNALLMFYLAERIWYVSERHTLQFVMLSCVLAAAGLEPVMEFICSLPVVGRLFLWPRAAPASLLLAIVASALPFTLQSLHAQREGHKHAGLWLANHIQKTDWLKDPLAWAEWYAGRTLYSTTAYGGDENQVVQWVVVEEGKNPHSRLPQWEKAKELAERGTLVYRWPESPKPNATVVCVYRVDPVTPAANDKPAIANPTLTVAPSPREVPGTGDRK